MFLPSSRRAAETRLAHDGTASLGHVVEALGVPLPEVGELVVDGVPASGRHRPAPGTRVEVRPVARPQRVPLAEGEDAPSFLLDVHLGTLARRMRLLGLDTAYDNDCDDPSLVRWASAERRVLLTQDRGLLRRRALWFGAYVRGSRPDDQLDDVLDRFAPILRPWTRCTACNGPLVPVDAADVADALEEGTRRTQTAYGRCAACGRIYWRGAHGEHLAAIVARAERIVATRTP
ncbi:Mut7-C RNAse domain-containing protein [Actinomadura rubteroloni]